MQTPKQPVVRSIRAAEHPFVCSAPTPFPVMTFGPFTLVFTRLPLDPDGFPTDVFINEPNVPFTMDVFFPSSEATLTGTLRFRNVPVTN